jgi:hypothetical protein
MYKHKNKTRLAQSKRPLHWLKRKILVIMTAIMLGMANGMNTEDQSIKGKQNYTEHHKKD